jgi:NAD(P)-dependent dehydrogenase (short-subunit alcohol dehydrogenase family)
MSLPQHALVTGGATGIGRAVAEALWRAGVKVTICGRRAAALEEAAGAMAGVRAIVADVTDERAVEALWAEAEKGFGPVDLAVPNAGLSPSGPLAKTSLADWQATLSANLTGAFLTARAALPGMLERQAGRIVFIASTAGLRGYAYVAPYAAAKHGVIGLMRSLALETAKSGITVNAVCPGFTRTEMLEGSLETIMASTGRSREAALAALTRFNPQDRLIEPDEVAAAVLWLAGDAARSVTGQALSISGGETW